VRVSPNPCFSVTNIQYSLDRKASVSLKLYDSLGRLVRILLDDERPAGSHVIRWNSERIAAGVYFLRLETHNCKATKKLVLLK